MNVSWPCLLADTEVEMTSKVHFSSIKSDDNLKKDFLKNCLYQQFEKIQIIIYIIFVKLVNFLQKKCFLSDLILYLYMKNKKRNGVEIMTAQSS